MALSPTASKRKWLSGLLSDHMQATDNVPKGVQADSDYFENSKSPTYSNKLKIQVNRLIHFLDINTLINFTVKKILSYSYTADNAHKYR